MRTRTRLIGAVSLVALVLSLACATSQIRIAAESSEQISLGLLKAQAAVTESHTLAGTPNDADYVKWQKHFLRLGQIGKAANGVIRAGALKDLKVQIDEGIGVITTLIEEDIPRLSPETKVTVLIALETVRAVFRSIQASMSEVQ